MSSFDAPQLSSTILERRKRAPSPPKPFRRIKFVFSLLLVPPDPAAWCMVHGAWCFTEPDRLKARLYVFVCVCCVRIARVACIPPPPSPISFFFVGNALLSLMKLKPHQETIKTTGNARFAYDTYRRFLNLYSDVVMDLDQEPFEEVRILHGRHLQPQVLPIFITFLQNCIAAPPPIGVNAIHCKRTSQSVVGSYDTIKPLTGIIRPSRMTPEDIPRSRCRVLVWVFVCVYVCLYVYMCVCLCLQRQHQQGYFQGCLWVWKCEASPSSQRPKLWRKDYWLVSL